MPKKKTRKRKPAEVAVSELSTAAVRKERDARALDHVRAFRASLEVTKISMDEELRRHRDVFLGIWREGDHGYAGWCRRAMKEPMKAIDTATAHTVSALLPETPVVLKNRKLEGRDNSEKIQKLIKWRFAKTAFRAEAVKQVQTAMWAGYSTIEVPFEKKVRTVKGIGDVRLLLKDSDGNPILDDNGRPTFTTHRTVVEKEFVDYKGAWARWVDPFHVWFDPRYENPNVDGPGMLLESEMSWKQVQALEADGVFHDVERLLNAKSDRPDTLQFESQTGLPAPSVFGPYHPFKIWTFWGLWDPEEDGNMVESVIVVANETTVLRAEQNPFWHGRRPILFSRLHDTGNGLGRGYPEMVESDSFLLDDIVCQRVDNITLILNAIMKYKKGSVDPKDVYTDPGHGVPFKDNPTDFTYERPPDVASSSYRETDRLTQNIRETVGATNPVQGIPSAEKTATEARFLRSSSATRFLEIVKRFEESLVKSAAEMYYQIDQQTLDEEVAVRLGIGEIELIGAEDIAGEYDVIPMAATEMLSREDAITLAAVMDRLILMQQRGLGMEWDINLIFERFLRASGVTDAEMLRKQTPPAQAPIEPTPQVAPELAAPSNEIQPSGANGTIL